jgi:hypothetical protein
VDQVGRTGDGVRKGLLLGDDFPDLAQLVHRTNRIVLGQFSVNGAEVAAPAPPRIVGLAPAILECSARSPVLRYGHW